MDEKFVIKFEIESDEDGAISNYYELYSLLLQIIGSTSPVLSADRVADAVRKACRYFAISV